MTTSPLCKSRAAGAAALAVLLLAAGATAQGGLEALQRRFAQERDALIAAKQGQVGFEDIRVLATRHAKELDMFLAGEASLPDQINGRLMLTNIYLDIGAEDEARAALGKIDPAKAPAFALLTAAEMAQILGMADQRTQWLDLALKKETVFDERMALASFLITRLEEIERGEKIFADALKAATDDEQSAKVLWYQADTQSRREDLADGAYEDALKALAGKYPDTKFGSIAADRRLAMAFRVGDAAVPLSGKGLDGKKVALADYLGKVVLLHFWTSWSPPSLEVADVLVDAQASFGERGFALLGVCLDQDAKAAQATADKHGMSWAHLFDGQAMMSDAAMRYAVEQVPHFILIGKDGKIAALRLFLHDKAGVADFRAAVEAALE